LYKNVNYGIILLRGGIMKLTKMKCAFVILGEYTKNEKLQLIKNEFSGYKLSVMPEQIGMSLNNQIIVVENVEDNINIYFRNKRIDIEYRFANQSINDFEILPKVLNIFKRILSIFNFNGNRIAYNTNNFAIDDNFKIVQKIYDRFNLFDDLDNVKEIAMRVNNNINYNNETFNAIVTINNYKFTNAGINLLEEKNAIMLTTDINTLPECNFERFNPDNLNIFYTKMIEITKERIMSFENLIGESLNG
jgi:hypothetical protein